ncbi:uncharacterized protein RJT21DRAFT_115523 [Scheffersomyces amazonensis]|uniref:uncharacterized protein n=1 Tax=Scheffersomyces amazonensis TaxID=1078765 RepID=UPI00315D7FF4
MDNFVTTTQYPSLGTPISKYVIAIIITLAACGSLLTGALYMKLPSEALGNTFIVTSVITVLGLLYKDIYVDLSDDNKLRKLVFVLHNRLRRLEGDNQPPMEGEVPTTPIQNLATNIQRILTEIGRFFNIIKDSFTFIIRGLFGIILTFISMFPCRNVEEDDGIELGGA